jgi:cold shock protein
MIPRAHLRAPNRSAPVSGVVKWFSSEKGFGFVELSDGSGDAFLHGSLLTQGGIAAVQPGEKVALRPTTPVDIGSVFASACDRL